MRRASKGFTLIEILVFILVSSLLMSTILIGSRFALLKTPEIRQQWIATQLARQCMEALLTQERQSGQTYACPSSPTHPLCVAPSNYTLSTSVSCTTWNSDSTYQTLTVTVGGLSNSSLSIWLGKN